MLQKTCKILPCVPGDALNMPDVKLIVKTYFIRYGQDVGLERLNGELLAKYGTTLNLATIRKPVERVRSGTLPDEMLSSMIKRKDSMFKKLIRRFSSSSSQSSASSKKRNSSEVDDLIHRATRSSSRRSSSAEDNLRRTDKKSERAWCSKSRYSRNRRLSLTKLRYTPEDVRKIDRGAHRLSNLNGILP